MKRLLAVLLSAVLVLCHAPLTALANQSAQALFPGDGTVSVPATTGSVLLCFTPDESGSYCLSSFHNTADLYCKVYNREMEELGSDDDGGENGNFRLVCDMTGGELYYFEIGFYSGHTEDAIPVNLEKLDYYVRDMRIVSEPNVRSVIKGVTYLPDLSGLQLEITWSDG